MKKIILVALLLAGVVYSSGACAFPSFDELTEGSHVLDTGITTAVKTKLFAAGLKNIHVTTQNRVVILSGTVNDKRHAMLAEKIAEDIGKVRNIVNNIEITD